MMNYIDKFDGLSRVGLCVEGSKQELEVGI